jgi:lipocalin
LSRTAKINQDLYNRIIADLTKDGYPTDKLKITEQ